MIRCSRRKLRPARPITPTAAFFFAADKRAQDLAQLRLKTNPDDANALFAMTLSVGMQADYASLIDKHQVESLKMIRRLLIVTPRNCWWSAPDAADAYFTLGAANYIIGSLPGYKKLSSRLRWNPWRQARLAYSSSRSPPRAAIISGRLRKFCWL